MRARTLALLLSFAPVLAVAQVATDTPTSFPNLAQSGVVIRGAGGGCPTATVIYDTTHAATLGAELAPTANGPATCLGDKIVLGSATTERSICEIAVDMFTLNDNSPFNLTMELYSDCTTNGTGNSPCGNGVGTLIPGSTVTVNNIQAPALGTIFTVVIPFPNVSVDADPDDTITVKLNPSRNNVLWRINETPTVGAIVPGEPATSFVERCGSVGANNGCSRNFGVNNNFAMTIRAVGNQADLSITKTDSADPVGINSAYSYTLNVNNAGPSPATNVSVTDTLPAGVVFGSATGTGWTCNFAAPTVTCTQPTLAVGAANPITINVTSPSSAGLLSNTAAVTATEPDPNAANNSDTETTQVNAPASVSGTKTVSGSFVRGGAITYTIVLTNSGAGVQGDNPGDEFTDVLPASLVLVSASATSGTAVATVGTNTVTWNGSLPAGGGSTTITINATISNSAPFGTISNQGTISFDADGNGTNESTTVTDDPGVAGAGNPTPFGLVAPLIPVPALGPWGLAVIGAALLLLALVQTRRRART